MKKFKVLQTLFFILIIMFALNVGYVKKIDYSNVQAEKLLKEIYEPLENFNRNLIVTEDEKLLLPPESIKNEEDFINSFSNRITDSQLNDFYETLVTEKDQKLYIDGSKYIPSIYSEDGKVTKAYVKKTTFLPFHKPKYEEKLIIKESWTISGELHKRTNTFVKNQNGEWMLQRFNGTVSYGFTDVKNNPWSLNRV